MKCFQNGLVSQTQELDGLRSESHPGLLVGSITSVLSALHSDRREVIAGLGGR